jgi:hypothetical protein
MLFKRYLQLPICKKSDGYRNLQLLYIFLAESLLTCSQVYS